MYELTIDGKQFKVEPGHTILDIARDNDIDIPTYCFHEELSPYGACRLCMVEIVESPTGQSGLRPACLYKVEDGLVVKTDTERIHKTRKLIYELLLARAPEDEKLKELALEYGVRESRAKLGEEIEKDNCILCGLCVRVCDEIVKQNAIGFFGRGIEKRVETPMGKISETCIGCGACAYLCPTGTIKIEEFI